jgi:hypothetical protein
MKNKLYNQIRQCAYNATQSLVLVTIVAVGKRSLLHSCIKCIKASNKRALLLWMLFLIGIQHAMFLRHIVICGPFGSAKFFYVSKQTVLFSKRQSNPVTCPDRHWGFHEAEVPGISRQSAHEGGKVVRLKYRPPLLPANIAGTHFC